MNAKNDEILKMLENFTKICYQKCYIKGPVGEIQNTHKLMTSDLKMSDDNFYVFNS